MRILIQEKLNEIDSIESSEPITDDIVEKNKTYFGYELATSYKDSDLERNNTYRATITGHVIRKRIATENTLEILDNATKDIISKLKELNFKCSFQDVSIDNGIKKIRLTGYVEYNEINNGLVL